MIKIFMMIKNNCKAKKEIEQLNIIKNYKEMNKNNIINKLTNNKIISNLPKKNLQSNILSFF